jgi:hypothetical protein
MLAVVALGVLAASLGACQRSLFMGSDSYTRSVVDRYWEGDSARETTAARTRGTDMGFGFPTGMANQHP